MLCHMLLHAYFSFEYAGVKYDQVSIEKQDTVSILIRVKG
ncbi:hypothetical protein EA72_00546 [Enterococcus faecium]|nr:hypothetical protein EA95_01118 [Enterococcus faecium]RBT28533.1 hypothetical protein EA72_00546 [Enterococcus faecium]RBT31823.1 hypothetical protein EB01_01755 [Enterococcus faecium]